jgi:hypothetical protein
VVIVVSAESKLVAKAVAAAVRGRPTVTRYWDDSRTIGVDVAALADHPQSGVTSYSTVNLSDWELLEEGRPYPTRVEIVAACQSSVPNFALAVSTSALFIINSKWFCYPGAIFPNVLAMYELSPTMKHFFFVEPYLWQGLEPLRIDARTVSWLMAVPISDTEYRYAIDNGHEALDSLFLNAQIDVYRLDRPSVV